MIRDVAACLSKLETWEALLIDDNLCVFTFVTGEYFEVPINDLEQPSMLLLELIYAVYNDHERLRESQTFVATDTTPSQLAQGVTA
jgi:hypothetical protein